MDTASGLGIACLSEGPTRLTWPAAALLGQTSMPLGGENTNTVIAAHRGYYGARKCCATCSRYKSATKLPLTTPWDTLVYRVCELKIIQPDDINAVLIQPAATCLP